jgi:RHS repeat-associated protein
MTIVAVCASCCTGKERDAESGLDYFGARHYGSALGRFASPDEVLADQHPEDPQSWNLYGYVQNNPLKNVDPTGKGTVNSTILNNPEAQQLAAKLNAGVAAYAKQSLNENKQGLNRISDLIKSVSGVRIDLGHLDITPLSSAEQTEVPAGAAVVSVAAAFAGGVKGAPEISMTEAVDVGAAHTGGGVMEETGKGMNYQFRNTTTDQSGNTVSKMGRFDVNPSDPHVQADSAHLNLETQVNGAKVSNQHIPIDPNTVRPGDHP